MNVQSTNGFVYVGNTPSHMCILRPRNHMVNEIAVELADKICHDARHNVFGERFIGYATDSEHIRLYGVRAKEGDRIALILQKDFKTVASTVLDDVKFFEEFNKTATCYQLTVRWGGKIVTLTENNSKEVAKAFAKIIAYKVGGQRCGRL